MQKPNLKRTLRMLALIAGAGTFVQCAWIVGFESSYSVGVVEGDGQDGAVGDGDAPASGPDSQTDGGVTDADVSFGEVIVVATNERTPFGGITADKDTVYWTLGTQEGGVRAASMDGGEPREFAPVAFGGSFQEMVSLTGDSVYWRVAETGCAANIGCGGGVPKGWGLCGTISRRMRTDGRRLYLSGFDAAGNDYPFHVVSKGCGSMAAIKRLANDGGPGYVNFAPDTSGNRLFAVAASDIDCVDIATNTFSRVTSANVLDLAADDGHVYWLTPSELHRCTLGSDTSCAPCTSDEVITRTSSGIQAALLLVDGSLYWLGASSISRIAANAPPGTAETVLVTGQASPVALAVDSNGIYWANGGDGSIKRMPRR